MNTPTRIPSTCDLCDEHGDWLRVVAPLFRNYGGRESFSGPTATIRCREDNSLVREAVNQSGLGRVLVVDGGGSVSRALLGDMLGAKAVANGWAGIVIHGAVRDVEVLRTLDLGVVALGAIPMRSEKNGAGERDVVVTFGGVTWSPGDWVYADASGIVVATESLVR